MVRSVGQFSNVYQQFGHQEPRQGSTPWNANSEQIFKWVNHHAVRAPVFDLEEPEGVTKWGFVSGCMAGLRHRHDSLPKSKESQIRALEKGRHQHSSSLEL